MHFFKSIHRDSHEKCNKTNKNRLLFTTRRSLLCCTASLIKQSAVDRSALCPVIAFLLNGHSVPRHGQSVHSSGHSVPRTKTNRVYARCVRDSVPVTALGTNTVHIVINIEKFHLIKPNSRPFSYLKTLAGCQPFRHSEKTNIAG